MTAARDENVDLSDLVIHDAIRHATELKQALRDERAALQNRDTEALHRAIGSKDFYIRKLEELERERQTAGLDDDSADPSLRQEYQRLVRECEALNLANGAVVRLRSQQVADGLTLLRGSEAAIDTYGPAGTPPTSGSSRGLAQA